MGHPHHQTASEQAMALRGPEYDCYEAKTIASPPVAGTRAGGQSLWKQPSSQEWKWHRRQPQLRVAEYLALGGTIRARGSGTGEGSVARGGRGMEHKHQPCAQWEKTSYFSTPSPT